MEKSIVDPVTKDVILTSGTELVEFGTYIHFETLNNTDLQLQPVNNPPENPKQNFYMANSNTSGIVPSLSLLEGQQQSGNALLRAHLYMTVTSVNIIQSRFQCEVIILSNNDTVLNSDYRPIYVLQPHI